MVVRFETRREDFPPNIDNLKNSTRPALLHPQKDNFTVEIPVRHLQFTERDGIGTVGRRRSNHLMESSAPGAAMGELATPLLVRLPSGNGSSPLMMIPEVFVIDEVRRIRGPLRKKN